MDPHRHNLFHTLHACSVETRPGARIGYVPQSPWIMSGSVRDNVLLGQPLDAAWYSQVMFACALMPDLAAMPNGDLSAVGDCGSALSGGQRARLALARALYHR